MISLRENDESRGDKTPSSFVESPDRGIQTAAGFFIEKKIASGITTVWVDFFLNPHFDIYETSIKFDTHSSWF